MSSLAFPSLVDIISTQKLAPIGVHGLRVGVMIAIHGRRNLARQTRMVNDGTASQVAIGLAERG